MDNALNSNLEVNPNLDQIRETLTCSICHEMVTLPVHGMCCERAKQLNPACLGCVRRYYELNKRPHERTFSKKSWGGCGCQVFLNVNKFSNAYYSHTLQLDMIRNLFGTSRCPNENCNVECRTSAELRRHLTGQVLPSDKNPPCQEALCKCDYCGFFGKRRIVNGIHYLTNHSMVYCRICDRQILFKDADNHYNRHFQHLQDYLTDFIRVKNNIRIAENNILETQYNNNDLDHNLDNPDNNPDNNPDDNPDNPDNNQEGPVLQF